MKKLITSLVITLILVIFVFSCRHTTTDNIVSAPNIFKYELRAYGGIRVGSNATNILIDSITTKDGKLRIKSGNVLQYLYGSILTSDTLLMLANYLRKNGLDSIGWKGDNLVFYRGSDTISAYIKVSDRESYEDVLLFNSLTDSLATKAYARTRGGGSSSSIWGLIAGTLSDQTDLQSALDAKVPFISTTNLNWTHKLSITMSSAGSSVIVATNNSATTNSKGLYGRHYATSGTGTYSGVYGIADGAAPGATKIGVNGVASGGKNNYGVYTPDNMGIGAGDTLIFGDDVGLSNTATNVLMLIGGHLAKDSVAISELHTISKTIAHPGHVGMDFTWTSAAGHVAQIIDLGAIFPSQSRIVAVELVCTQAATGVTDITIGVGTTSGGAELVTAASSDSQNEVLQSTTTLTDAILMNWANYKHIYLIGDPTDANWSDMAAGTWKVFITYRRNTNM